MRPGPRSARGRPALALLLLAPLLGGCASLSLGRSLREIVQTQIREQGLDPAQVVLPFEPNDEMRSWVRESLTTGGSPEQQLQQLLRALLRRPAGDLVYEHGYTATAQEVWATGKANCLSFTHLYVGLARELDLPVYYLRVADLQSFEKDGDLIVASEHITAAYGPPTERMVLDFSDRPVRDYRQVEPVSDLVAVALYYSNLGAQRIREGRTEEAFQLLEIAARLAPELGDAWVNLGVAHRRMGRLPEAEAAFRRALEANPRLVSAYSNLSVLLGRLGRHDEAARLLTLTDRASNRNPFSYLALGDLSLREGRLEEAARFYRRAQRLEPGRAESLAALGQWALAAGKVREAERWLRKASKADPTEPRVAELARSLHARTASG